MDLVEQAHPPAQGQFRGSSRRIPRAWQLVRRLTRTADELAALGREVPFVELTHAQAVEQLSASAGEHAGWYLDWTAELDRHPQPAVPTVAEITGRPGTTFAQWAVAHVDHFR